jgi:hypothetical protein
MKAFNKHLGVLVAAASLILLIAGASPLNEIEAATLGACEKGLAVCIVTSALEIGNPVLWCAYATWCLNGYSWCKAYVEPFL